MKMKGGILLVSTVASGILVAMAFSQARAYSIYGPTSTTSTSAAPSTPSSAHSPGGWFPSFGSFASRPPQDVFRARTQNALRQFDEWLYGIAGFRIIGLFTATLSILSWILGAVKGGVDWLLGLFTH